MDYGRLSYKTSALVVTCASFTIAGCPAGAPRNIISNCSPYAQIDFSATSLHHSTLPLMIKNTLRHK